jgi:hypothetical protein
MKRNNKQIFVLILLSMCYVIYYPFTSFSQVESELNFYRSFEASDTSSGGLYPVLTDQLSLDTYYWGQMNDGITPYEILYIASFNKLYVYGSSGIDVIDPSTMMSETVISHCDYGQYFKDPIILSTGSNRMVFDGDHLLYCFTDELHLVSIDLQSNLVVNSVNVASEDMKYYYDINNTCLRYDNTHNYIFLSLTIHGSTYYFRFNAPDISQYYSKYHFRVEVFDLDINKTSNNIFVCYSMIIDDEKKYYFSVYDFNFDPVQGVPGFESTDPYRYIEYIFDPIYGINEAICFPLYYYLNDPTPFAQIIDGNSFSMRSIELMDNQTFITSTDYIPAEHIIYFSYNTNNRGIGKFHVLNDEVEDIYVYPGEDYISDICVSESKIFLGEKNKIEIIDKSNPSYITSFSYIDDFILDIAPTIDKVHAVNYSNCSIESFDLNGDFLESTVLGGANLFGVHNSFYNKAYMYRYFDQDIFQRIYSMNLNNQEQTVIDFSANGMGWITDMVSDEERNRIYVAIRNDPEVSNSIEIINAADNVVQTEGFELPENMVCKNLYMANNKLYCLLEWHPGPIHLWPRIYIIDLDNPSNTTLLPFDWYPILEGGIHAWFDQDSFGNIYMSIIEGVNGNGKVLKIDGASNQINSIISVDSPRDIVYYENNNKAYFTQISSSSFGIVDFDLQTVNYIDLTNEFEYLLRPFIDVFRNKLCITGHFKTSSNWNSTYTRFAWIDFETNAISDLVTVEDMAISIEYNKLNGDLFAFYPNLWTDSYFQGLGIISRDSFTNSFHRLINGHRGLKGPIIFDENEMFFEKDHNYLFVPNNYFSDFYRIELKPDYITLQPGKWNWLSFPRLEREDDDPVLARPVMESIDPFPTYLNMLNRPLQENDPPTYYIKHDEIQGWTGDLENVQSTFGYKLETDNEDISYLPMTGSVLDAETQITIYPGHENWVGYFLPETQHPFDVIPASILQNLSFIKAQYWSCVNSAFIAPPPKSTSGSTSQWRCACNQLRMEMTYDDMVIMVLGTREPESFVWNRAGGGGNIIHKDAPEFFQFSEQPDYEAMFIELDSIDLPDEIGAFAGDSCIGATKVLPDDTAAMICAYTQGFEGEEISFELMYPTKTTRPVIKDYLVFNKHTRINERRKITVGEKQPFYMVSFNKNKDNTDMVNASWIHCLPNPARDEATITYFISNETKVKIMLTNILGKEIMDWDQERQNAGEYRFKVNTSSLPAGYYLVSATAGHQTCAKKLLIVH